MGSKYTHLATAARLLISLYQLRSVQSSTEFAQDEYDGSPCQAYALF